MNNSRTAKYIASAVEREVEIAASAQRGQRNDVLFKSTASIATFVQAGLSEETIRNRMIEAAERNGLLRDDGLRSVTETIESGISAGREIIGFIPEEDNGQPGTTMRAEDAAAARRAVAASPAETNVPADYPAWTPEEGGQQPSYSYGEAEPAPFPDEVDRFR